MARRVREFAMGLFDIRLTVGKTLRRTQPCYQSKWYLNPCPSIAPDHLFNSQPSELNLWFSSPSCSFFFIPLLFLRPFSPHPCRLSSSGKLWEIYLICFLLFVTTSLMVMLTVFIIKCCSFAGMCRACNLVSTHPDILHNVAPFSCKAYCQVGLASDCK